MLAQHMYELLVHMYELVCMYVCMYVCMDGWMFHVSRLQYRVVERDLLKNLL
jgi:hypothetical protein